MNIKEMRQAIRNELEYIYANEQFMIQELVGGGDINIDRVLFSSDFISFKIHHKGCFSEVIYMEYDNYLTWKTELEAAKC